MDYKANALNDLLKCEEQAVPDIPTLMFGTIPNGPLVFDSTAFYKANNFEEIDYKVFQRLNKRYIESFISNADIKASDLFFINKDGHVLMHHELTFLFLAFAMPTLAAYFNGLIGEVMANGVAYSDGFALSLASERIPSDILQQIINNRNNAEKV